MRDYNGTTLINATERYTFEIPDRPVDGKQLGQVIYKTRQKRKILWSSTAETRVCAEKTDTRGDFMFTGFTPETIDFLWGIRMNNNRDWFLEHKKQYVSTLYEPMKALGQDAVRALYGTFRGRS